MGSSSRVPHDLESASVQLLQDTSQKSLYTAGRAEDTGMVATGSFSFGVALSRQEKEEPQTRICPAVQSTCGEWSRNQGRPNMIGDDALGKTRKDIHSWWSVSTDILTGRVWKWIAEKLHRFLSRQGVLLGSKRRDRELRLPKEQ